LAEPLLGPQSFTQIDAPVCCPQDWVKILFVLISSLFFRSNLRKP